MRKMSKAKSSPLRIIEAGDVNDLDKPHYEALLLWIDKIPLSRPKKNLVRDFSDGVLFAEVIRFFLPKYVELHNFSTASSSRLKQNNWFHINRKVLNLLRMEISHDVIRDIVNYKPWAVESVLCVLRGVIEDELARLHAQKHQLDHEFKNWLRADLEEPEVDQVVNTGRKHEFHSLDDFYMSQGLKTFPNKSDYEPVADSSHVSPRHQQIFRKVQEMVPRAELDQRVQACEEKRELIDTLQRRVKRLEHMLHLKDLRVDEMSTRLRDIQDQFSGLGGYMEGYPSPTLSPRRDFTKDTPKYEMSSPMTSRRMAGSKALPGRTRRRLVGVGGGATRR